MIQTIITFIIVFGILVIVHEFGHFYFAKKSGILVREFSIGMGPKIYAYSKNATTYTLRILPIGGYVRMAGLEDADDDLKPGTPVSLITGENGKVQTINASHSTTLLNGIPIEVTKSDLENELWIEGYENGDESELKRYEVDHDASIIEADGTKVRIAPKDVQFQSAKLWQRILTNFAGPMNNFILAIVVFALVGILQGAVPANSNQVTVVPDSVAKKAGLKSDDRIIRVAGTKTTDWTDLQTTISKRPGQKTTIVVQRNGRQHQYTLTPKSVKGNDGKVGQIGIESKMTRNLGSRIAYGFTETWKLTTMIFALLGHMVTHGVSVNDFGGPVAIYVQTSAAAKLGFTSVLTMLAYLSLNLGIVNLIPIPALDGGKILLNFIEGIRRKPMKPETEGIITLVGFGLLMLLMVLVTWNDIQRYFF
ncbi:RIP metalloprotease RseP [Pediococcus siamensis]|uniref:RIP metalloprotease RseP n=1 Tax=Pediococcus siamensis TaxID=381829 RepID=UPI0039A25166